MHNRSPESHFSFHHPSFSSCPPPLDSIYCLNGGSCFTSLFSDEEYTGQRSVISFHCQCEDDFHGARCEYLFNSELYGFMVAREGGDELGSEGLAVGMLSALLICIILLCWVVWARRWVLLLPLPNLPPFRPSFTGGRQEKVARQRGPTL